MNRVPRTVVVIPARMGSTRFPAKVLSPLGGIPVVEWCRRAAVQAGVGPVIVATDHSNVIDAVKRFGGSAVLTPLGCRSGTDRVYAAVRSLERARGLQFRTVVNLQGDEPFIHPSTIRKVAELARGGGADIATAVVPMPIGRSAADPNVVKAVLSCDGRCLYFSRAAVPSGTARLWRHIGIYAFAREALERFVKSRPSPLEAAERLEQLRALEGGMTIAAARVSDRTIAIDTPADLRRASRRLARRV